MKLNRDCRFGSDCRKNQSGACPYMHPHQPRHHKQPFKRDDAEKIDRERSRQVQLRRGEKKYTETKNKHHQHRQDNRHSERWQKSPEVQYKSRQYRHHYDKEVSRNQQKSKYQIKNEVRPQQKPEERFPAKHQAKHQPKSSKPPNQTSNKSQPPVNNARLAIQKQFSKFCLNFHLENRCDHKQTCNKLHSFLFKDQQLVRRKIFQQSPKLTTNSRLAFTSDQQRIFYIVKTQKQCGIYLYKPAKNQIVQPAFKPMEFAKQTKRDYFACQASLLYFSYVNDGLGLYDLLLFNIATDKQFSVHNAHVKEVTGITQLEEDKFLTVSLDGTMKVWNLDNQKSTWMIDNQATQKFRNLYNPDGKSKQLNCVQKMTFGLKNLICVGSDDSKLLFFINQTPLSFKEVVVSQSQLKILKIKKINQSTETLELLVLAHSKTKSLIFRIRTDLTSPHKSEKLIQLENQEGKRINTFQSHQDYLFVSYGKEVVFYSLANPKNILGGIMHSSPINNLAVTTYLLKQTGVKFHILAVLQGSGGQQKKGNLSIYFIQ